MVEVRGTIVRNYEWAIIKSHGFGGGIDFEYPDQLEKPVQFSLLKDAEYERFEDGLAETKEPSKGELLMLPDYKNDVTATFTGRLDGCPTHDRNYLLHSKRAHAVWQEDGSRSFVSEPAPRDPG